MAKVGRPRLIQSPEEFDDRADTYFAMCEETNRAVTVTGLALALGLSSRESLDEYGRRPEFSDNVRNAKLRVEECYEQRLHGTTPTGAIFALKNMGWSDKQEQHHSGELGIRRIERVIRNAED